MGPLIKKLAGLGLDDISYMIVNDKSDKSQILFPVLQQRAPSGMPVYQQTPEQDDVWEMLNGDKDDFLIYDRCGRLIFHIRLPYSYLHYRYVEAAIRSTYFQDYCKNCSFYANITAQNVNASTANSTDPEPSPASAVTSEKKKKEPEKYQDKPRQGPSRQPESEERHHSHPDHNRRKQAHVFPIMDQQQHKKDKNKNNEKDH